MAEPPASDEGARQREVDRDSTLKTDTMEQMYNTHNKRHDIRKGFIHPAIGEQAISLD